MKILKRIVKSKHLEVVKTEPILGGEYAFVNWNLDLANAKTGLTLDCAMDLFETVKQLEKNRHNK